LARNGIMRRTRSRNGSMLARRERTKLTRL
jgi:hypothetical protein